MKFSMYEIPPIKELKNIIRKKSYDTDRFGDAMFFIRPFQVYFTYFFLKRKISSIQVTIIWFFVALLSYLLNVLGHPFAFVVATLFIYLKTLLDGVDGEISRYHKNFLSREEDAILFINGKYLDLVFHSIEQPLWGMSIAVGLFYMYESIWILVAGMIISVYHSYARHSRIVKQFLHFKFKTMFTKLYKDEELILIKNDDSGKDSIFQRVIDKLSLWIRNGKLFNFMIMIGSMIDSICYLLGYKSLALLFIFMSIAFCCPVLVCTEIVGSLSKNELSKAIINEIISDE